MIGASDRGANSVEGCAGIPESVGLAEAGGVEVYPTMHSFRLDMRAVRRGEIMHHKHLHPHLHPRQHLQPFAPTRRPREFSRSCSQLIIPLGGSAPYLSRWAKTAASQQSVMIAVIWN